MIGRTRPFSLGIAPDILLGMEAGCAMRPEGLHWLPAEAHGAQPDLPVAGGGSTDRLLIGRTMVSVPTEPGRGGRSVSAAELIFHIVISKIAVVRFMFYYYLSPQRI